MKVLFITEKFPYPLDSGGNIRTFNILKGLSRAHELTLVSTCSGRRDQDFTSKLDGICKETICIPIGAENRQRLSRKIMKSVACNSPIVIERHYFRKVGREIERLLRRAASSVSEIGLNRSETYDVVHFNHLDATAYLPWTGKSALKVLDEHNIVSNQIRTSIEAEKKWLKRLYIRHELKKTQKFEAEICTRMNRCFVCSDVDKSFLSSIAPKAGVSTVPNGVDIEYFSQAVSENALSKHIREGSTMVFVGSLDYAPCDIGVRFFCEKVLPRIQSEIRDVKFVVIGRNPSKELQNLAKNMRGIHMTGWVEDIRPYAKAGKLFVVPLLSGSGTRLKILDAMAMGVPVLSTSIGAEGLEVRNQHDIVLRDTVEEFASSAVQLLRDEDMRQKVADAGSKLVRKMYSWERISKDLLNEYETLKYKN